MKKEKTIFDLLLDAEALEKKSTSRRIEIESEIFNMMIPKLTKQEGLETIEENGYSVTINQPVTYKLEEKKYRALAERMPENLQIHRVKLELDKIKYQSTLESESEWKKEIQDCVTSKPGKVSVKIKKNIIG
jgi:hypothetical protein